MDNQSINNIVQWLKAQPRTLGWDAICAYDRKKTNSVLLQDYINRFSRDNYLAPLNEKIKSTETDTHMEWIYDYVMDYPRLSFLDSPLMDSQAKLSMKVIGGAHLTYEVPTGAGPDDWELVRLAMEDALDGPVLKQDVRLEVVKGEIVEPGKSSVGLVRLDLAAGINPTLTFTESEHFRKLAGERIKQKFEMLPPEQRYYTLNEVIVEDGAFLEPDHFYIRTQQAPGATLGAENEGDGAVILFVTMKGRDDGGFPVKEEDLMYLIPDGDEYSATQLLSNKLVLQKVFSGALERLSTPPYSFGSHLQLDGAFYKIVFEGGKWSEEASPEWYLESEGDWGYPTFQVFGLSFPFNNTPNETAFCEMRLKDEELILEWNIKAPQYCQHYLATPGHEYGYIRIVFDCFWSNKFQVDPVFDKVFLTPAASSRQELVMENWSMKSLERNPDLASQVRVRVIDWVTPRLEALRTQFNESSVSINTYALNSLLFRSPDAVKLKDVYFPGDLLLLGKLGEKVSQFIIDPLEPVIGHTTPFQFTVHPAREMDGLTWTVHHVLDDTGEIGSIDETTGLYQPPTAAQLKKGFTRVRVTAKKGRYESSALVHVMVADISINPLITTCSAGGAQRHLSAGTLSGELSWGIPDNTSGAKLEEHPTEKGKYIFTSGPKVADKAYTFDEVVVENTTTRNKQTAYVMNLHGVPDLSVKLDTAETLPENQLKLVAYRKSSGLPVTTKRLEWQVLLGAATVDQVTGVCTVDPTGPLKFVVVAAHIPAAEFDDDVIPAANGSIILPVPAFSLPEATRLLSPGID